MKVHRTDRWTLINGECVIIMQRLPENRFDAVVTDPPYELGFMGKRWDSSGVAFRPETWAAALRVLKPGGYLLAFGGSRTFHRIACAIEDAGFEIRDTLSWLYGQGFPKSLDVSAAIDKQRQDDARPVCRFLRAAMERRGFTSRVVAETFGVHSRMVDHWAARDTDSQPTVPTLEQWERLKVMLGFGPEMDAEVYRLNARKGTLGEAWQSREVLGYETMPDASKVRPGFTGPAHSPPENYGARREVPITAPATEAARQWQGWGTTLSPPGSPSSSRASRWWARWRRTSRRGGRGRSTSTGVGVMVRTSTVVAASSMAGKSTGATSSGETTTLGRWPANVLLDEEAAALLDAQTGVSKSGVQRKPFGKGGIWRTEKGEAPAGPQYGDSGGASRFFYVAKASRAERDAGCEALPARTAGEATDREEGTAGLSSPRAGAGRTGGARNVHPTVKPVALMRWLVRLVTPPGGAVLDPFTGSGTTGVAALEEGFKFCGVEQSAEYVEIAKARLEHAAREET